MRIIGTAGHVDHGKSTLIAALTGTHPDRLKEEQEREMTIDLGFGWLTLPDGEEIGIVDVPGHRDFIENMLAGVGGIDAALLVIAADEGIMPQTREHLAILDLLQIPSGLIVLTKIDLIKDNLEEIIKRAMAVKIKIIEEDPYEKGLRASLNLGHTIGHAVELVSHFQLRHGEAVAIGMVAEAKLAERLTLASKGLSDAVAESLSALGLPILIPKELPRHELIRAMQMDKKKSNGLVRFALPVEIGRVELVDVTDLENVLED